MRHCCPRLAENVALDDALLARSVATDGVFLRFWTNPAAAVAIGTSEHVREVITPAALSGADALSGPEVVRRFTAGGSVVVGPGSLCVVLALPHTVRDPSSIHEAFAMFQTIVAQGLGTIGVGARLEPPSDLVVGDRKISGCAQARRLAGTLIHSTLLLEADTDAMEKFLRMPPRQPDYRAGRAHGEFVASLREILPGLADDALEDALIDAFAGFFGSAPRPEAPDEALLAETDRLTRTRYGLREWTLRK